MKETKIEKVIEAFRNFRNLREEVPTNALAGGNIAGTAEAGDDPPVKTKEKRKKYIYGKGYRKLWQQR